MRFVDVEWWFDWATSQNNKPCDHGDDRFTGQWQSTSTTGRWRVNSSDKSPLMGWERWWQSPWSLGNALGERAIFVSRSGAVATLQTVEQQGHHCGTNLHLTQSAKIWITKWSMSPKECVGSAAGTASVPWGAGVHLWAPWCMAQSTAWKILENPQQQQLAALQCSQFLTNWSVSPTNRSLWSSNRLVWHWFLVRGCVVVVALFLVVCCTTGNVSIAFVFFVLIFLLWFETSFPSCCVFESAESIDQVCENIFSSWFWNKLLTGFTHLIFECSMQSIFVWCFAQCRLCPSG